MIDFFLKRSFLVNLISAVTLSGGIVSLLVLNRDLLPPTSYKEIHIRAEIPGASSVDMERQVTFPIESVAKNLFGLKHINSKTSAGQAQIVLIFEQGFKRMREVLEETRAKVEELRPKLPHELKVSIEQKKTRSVPLLRVAFQNVKIDSFAHENWIRAFEEKVLKISGITEVDVKTPKHNIIIRFKKEALKVYGKSIPSIKNQILRNLRYEPIGRLKQDERVYSIEVKRPLLDLESLKNMIILANESVQIPLSNLATIFFRPLRPDNLFYFNQNPAVLIEIKKDMNSDLIDLREQVSGVIHDFNQKMPDQLKISTVVDFASFIEKQLSVLQKNAGLGLILVGLMLIAFLGWKTALCVALGIPVAYLGTLIVLFCFNISINLISVVAMILVIGILVDDSIIISERFYNNLELGLGPIESASKTAKSLMAPVSGTILTTIIAFVPILLVENSWSAIFFPIPIVIIASLGLSWFECFFILPNHLAHFVKRPKISKTQVFSKLEKLYQRTLFFFLKFRYIVLALSIGLILLTIHICTNKLKRTIRMGADTPGVRLNIALRESSSLEQTYREIEPVYKHLQQYGPSLVENVWAKVGGARLYGKKWVEGLRYAQIFLTFKSDLTHPKQLEKDISTELKKRLAKYKTGNVEILQVGKGSVGQKSGEDIIRILVSGNDRLSFYDVQDEIKMLVQGVDGLQSLFIHKDLLEETWRFNIDDKSLVKYKMSSQDIAKQIRDFFSPQELLSIRYDGRQVKIYTEFPGKEHLDFSSLQGLKLISAVGSSIPLTNFGKWEKSESFKSIVHEDLQRVFEINARYDRDKTNFEQIKVSLDAALNSIRQKYPSFEFRIEEDRKVREAKSWVLGVIGLCVGLIFFVLAIVLNSLTQPLLVMLAIPFSLVGIVWALYFHGLPIVLTGVIGVLGVFGVAVNDSLIMVDTLNQSLKRRKYSLRRMILTASTRLRAVVLTTVTTLGGVLPMAYGLGGESGFTGPMAFSVGWGLISSTFLTLFLIPILVQIRQDLLKITITV